MILDWMENYWNALLTMSAEMAPYLLLGFFIAGLLRVFVPKTLYSKHLAPRNMKSVVKAAALGVPLPLCSCGVIPTAVGLRKEGASHGACTGFLIATPQTGVDSIIATYSLMGLPFAVVRPLAALFTAIFGGWLTNTFAREDEQHSKAQAVNSSSNGAEGTDGNSHCCCGHEHEDHEHGHGCSCGHEHEAPRSFGAKMLAALDYGFVDMMQDVGKWLVIGLLIAALITVAVPNEWLAALHEYKLLNMLLVLAVAIPMYVCATGSIPIAVSLMAKGLTPGAALVLLMAGPAVNSASMLVIGKVFGRRTLWLYILSIVIGAVVFGLGIDYLLPQEWFEVQSRIADACHNPAHALSFTDWLWVGLLATLLLHALVRHWWGAAHHSHGHCCCEAHEDECTATVYSVSGMNCNHCKTNVERAIRSVEGVEEVIVDLASATARVTGQHDSVVLIRQVKSFGYEAALKA